jgi:hypothetical protein
VVHFTDERINDPGGAIELGWREFHRARNVVVEACRRFGTIGPMDVNNVDLYDNETDADANWKATDNAHDDFYIDDDQLNDERYIYVELESPDKISVEFIQHLCASLEKVPNWGVGITNVNRAYL